MTEFYEEELDRYCYWQDERERIRLKKEVFKASPPWTEDPILREFKFCQVFREDDRTTRWFRTHVRDPLKNEPEVIMATVIFRWFNFINTGRTLIEHDLLMNWDREKAIEEVTKQPKWVTGAYIVKTPNGMDKVTGVAECVSHMWRDREHIINELEKFKEDDGGSLKKAWLLFKGYPYMGPFMAYEVVTDLRHTYILEDATDVLTWANAGPGAMRGLNRLTGRDISFSQRSHDWNTEMQELYALASKKLSPYVTKLTIQSGAVPSITPVTRRNPYELREIEGGLCEFDKYSRIYKKEGRTRSIFKYNKELPLVEDLIEGESIYVINGR